MHIAVNARFLIPGKLEGFGHYSHEILSRIARDHREDTLSLYFDREFSPQWLYGPHVQGVRVMPQARHPVLFYLWFQHTLKRALENARPDVFFSPDSFMPLGLKCPSVITIHDVAHQPFPEAISLAQRIYYRKYMPVFVKEARAILTVSEFSKREILKYYPAAEDKVTVIYNGIGDDYKPLPEEMRSRIRQHLTGGAPYFLFVGAIHPRKNVARLIEAYTLFRKSTRSDIKLVIAGRKSWDYKEVDRAIAGSPWRRDILVTGYLPADELARITAAAFALCYVSLYEGFGLPVAEAMACGVPVMVSRDSAQAEVAGPAGFLTDPLDTADISQCMQDITQDQELRARLIAEGLGRSTLFSWEAAAQHTYEVLKETADEHM